MSAKRLIVLFGAPGSGKGTQAHEFEKLGYSIISSGNAIRAFIRAEHNDPADQKLVEELKLMMDNGVLVPFDTLKYIVSKRIEQEIAAESVLIMEGIPRQPEQAEWLVEMAREFDIEIIFVHLLVSLEEVIKRITHRYFIPGSNTPYPSYEEAKKDALEGQEPVRRADDTAETVTKRYQSQYEAVVDDILEILWENEVKIVEIDATLGIAAIHRELEQYL
jgi:adenylate kinase